MVNKNIGFSREETEDFRNFIFSNKCNLDAVINNLLLVLGFKPKLVGVLYLKEAIRYCCSREYEAKKNFSGEVYPFVANKFKTKSNRVERNIRTAIQGCYFGGGMLKLNRLANYTLVLDSYPPSNVEFITGVEAWLNAACVRTDNSAPA